MEEDTDMDTGENNLVYPKIENVYFTLDNIKTEPIDIDSDDDDYQSMDLMAYNPSNDYYLPFPNKIILGGKPSSQLSVNPSPETVTKTQDGEQQVAGDFGCDDCNLTFPTQNELDSHRTSSHSFLVARTIGRAPKSTSVSSKSSAGSQSYSEDSLKEPPKSRQKAVKSTAKSSILNMSYPIPHKTLKNAANNRFSSVTTNTNVATTEIKSEKTDKLLCKHCNVSFPNEIALIKHTYELIPEKDFRQETDFATAMELKRPVQYYKKRKLSRPPNKFLQCTYCTCLLKYPNGLRKHVLLHHKTTACVMKYVNFPRKCGLCWREMPSQKQYNSHISKCHRKICHQSHKDKLSDIRTNASTRGKPDAKVLKSAVHASTLSQTSNSKSVIILKQTLFKCDKCQVHFVTCSSAVEHSRRCVLAKGNWKCNRCRRSFTLAERHIHTLQHGFSDTFNVHTVDDNILGRVLCRCTKCELHFDEATFWVHLASGCDTRTGVDCGVCDYKIHPKAFVKHRRNHATYDLTRTDYIVVDIVDATVQTGDVSDNEATTQTVAKKHRKHSRNVLYFCTNCKTHKYTLRLRDFHVSGRCRKPPERPMERRYCLTCGITVTGKMLLKHTAEDHQRRKLRLRDYTFVRYQDMKVIRPEMPDFVKCGKCGVRFATALKHRRHKCATQSFTKCSVCSQKYDTIAYNLHLAFHEYELSPAAVEDGESKLSEVFYCCASCNYGFDSYDDLVEHCQKHYTNSESMTTVACKMCKVNYAESHIAAHANRPNFKILKFNYQTLLSDDWMKGFEPVSKEEYEEVLLNSVYGVLRNVRLVLSSDGPPLRTLYRCAKCQLCIDPEGVVEHVKEQCNKNVRHGCDSCSAAFRTRASKIEHANLHVMYGDDIKFREIEFNDPIDRELNDALSTGVKEESIELKKCQYCPVFLKDELYQRHIDAHEKGKGVTKKKEILHGLRFFETAANLGNKMYTVYQCRACKLLVMRKPDLCRHHCAKASIRKCKKCSLWYHSTFKKNHEELHLKMPKFVKNNIRVIEFQLDKRNKTGPKHCSSENESVGDEFCDAAPETEENANGDSYAENEDQNDSTASVMKKRLKKEVRETDSLPDITKWVNERRRYLYQCDRCNLCFMQMTALTGHLSTCDANETTVTPLTCDRCLLTYHPSMASFHDDLHGYISKDLIENNLYITKVPVRGGDTADQRNWLYQCRLCDVNYLSYMALEYHFSRNHKTVKDFVSCDICKMRFAPITLKAHFNLHHKSDWSVNDAIIAVTEKLTIEPLEIPELASNGHSSEEITENKETDNTQIISDSSMTDRKVYKCTECSIHYINKHTLDRHYSTKRHNCSYVQCDICGLNFGSRTILKHKNIHHETLKLKRQDFIITDVTGEVVENDEKPNEKRNSNINNRTAYNVETVFNVMKNESLSETTESSSYVDNNLYKCVDCSIFYTNKATLKGHVVNKKGDALATSDCDICGLRFESDSLPNHKSVQHEELKLNGKDDFVITDILGCRAYAGEVNGRIVNYASSMDTDDVPLIEIEEMKLESKANAKRRETQIFKLYQCKDCRVCVQRTQRKFHVCCSDIQKMHCLKCSLSFRRTDYIQHRSLHRKHPQLSRSSILLIKFGHRTARNCRIYKCVTCSTHFLSLNALEWHMDAWNHRTKREKCDICGLYFGKFSLGRHVKIHHGKLKSTTDQLGVICVSDSGKGLSPVEALSLKSAETATNDLSDSFNSTSQSDVAALRVKKLFKCFDCDVYFLTQCSYYQHIYRHCRLDPTEFIACKMCYLQFLTESLGEHMRSHRDRSFSLDRLMVQGYLPDSNELTESHYNVDGHISKLVSTTTPFDNEVDTATRVSDEQLSTIDSTSDGVAKNAIAVDNTL